MKMTFQEIRIIATGPCIANQLRDVNTICRRSWYIAAHVWNIYDFKIEVVPLIINFKLIMIILIYSFIYTYMLMLVINLMFTYPVLILLYGWLTLNYHCEYSDFYSLLTIGHTALWVVFLSSSDRFILDILLYNLCNFIILFRLD